VSVHSRKFSCANETKNAAKFNEEIRFDEEFSARLSIAGTFLIRPGFLLADDFPEGAFDELALFIVRAAANGRPIQQRHQDRQTGEDETDHPVNDEADRAQSIVQDRHANDEHDQRGTEKNST
jgi:hypothetical protein